MQNRRSDDLSGRPHGNKTEKTRKAYEAALMDIDRLFAAGPGTREGGGFTFDIHRTNHYHLLIETPDSKLFLLSSASLAFSSFPISLYASAR